MVHRCCISNCRRGRYENGVHVSLFKSPNDIELYKKWEEVVQKSGNILKKNSFICEKHFREEDIKKECILKDVSGNVLFQRTLVKRRLSLTAVPMFFNNSTESKENSNDYSETSPEIKPIVTQVNVAGKSKKKTCKCAYANGGSAVDLLSGPSSSGLSSPPISENDKNSPELNAAINNILTDHSYLPSDSNTNKFATNSTSSIQITSCFSLKGFCDIDSDEEIERKCDIFSISHVLKLPNTQWAVHKLEEPKKLLIIAKLRPLFNGEFTTAPIIEKQIVMEENGRCQGFIFNVLLKSSDIYVNNLEELEAFIENLDSLNICVGGPSIFEYKNVHCTCAYKDVTNKWRHNRCKLVLERGLICKECVKLDKTLRNYLYTVFKKKNSGKMRLTLSPTKQKHLKAMKEIARVKTQMLKRSKIRCEKNKK